MGSSILFHHLNHILMRNLMLNSWQVLKLFKKKKRLHIQMISETHGRFKTSSVIWRWLIVSGNACREFYWFAFGRCLRCEPNTCLFLLMQLIDFGDISRKSRKICKCHFGSLPNVFLKAHIFYIKYFYFVHDFYLTWILCVRCYCLKQKNQWFAEIRIF